MRTLTNYRSPKDYFEQAGMYFIINIVFVDNNVCVLNRVLKIKYVTDGQTDKRALSFMWNGKWIGINGILNTFLCKVDKEI